MKKFIPAICLIMLGFAIGYVVSQMLLIKRANEVIDTRTYERPYFTIEDLSYVTIGDSITN